MLLLAIKGEWMLVFLGFPIVPEHILGIYLPLTDIKLIHTSLWEEGLVSLRWTLKVAFIAYPFLPLYPEISPLGRTSILLEEYDWVTPLTDFEGPTPTHT